MAVMNPAEQLDTPLITKVAFLEKPSAYPDHPQRVVSIETHMSWVFLTDQYAYKLKKPVVLDFLDYRTVDARRRYCEAEVILNRHLAPGVYLGTVPLAEDEGKRLGINGDGVVVDWLVQMRRLPAAERLDTCIKAGGIDRGRLAEALRFLIAAYQSAENAGVSAVSYRQKLEVAILRNAPALEFLNQHHVIERQLGFLNERGRAIGARAGYVLDAHGDLRPEHIYLLDPPVIVDRLEFNRDFRLLDPVDELAFLAVECERLGAGWIGELAFKHYRERTDDDAGAALVSFYKSLRACMRARLALGHLIEPGAERHSPWFRLAEHYAVMALNYAADMV